ncbi:MAG TPA: protein BatD [Bacteroides sp.]|nr:protein BatD [Bacteroides sp.]
MKLKFFPSVTLILLFSMALGGQDPVFTASAPAVVNVGEQFQYVVEGSEQGSLTLPPLGDFQLLAGPFSSYSSQSQWINGKMTMKTTVTYTHVLRATVKGTFTIPPATVKVGRKEYRTNEVQITVNEAAGGAGPGGTPPGGGQAAPSGTAPDNQPGETSPVFLRVIPSKTEVYVGEQFVSGLKVFTRVNTRPASSSRDIPYEGFYRVSVDPDATAQRQVIGGQQYLTQVIQRHILIPQKTGEVVVAPYESEWMIPQRVQRRSQGSIFDDFFDDPFFDSYQEVPVKLFTDPVTIHVKPLPPGAPEGFTGGVGSFTLEASLSAEEIEVNEALSLRITVRGTGNLPLLGEPDVNLPPDHDLYEVTRSVNTSTSGNRISGSVTFEYPIVARHAGRFRIAPVRFAWFDPAAKQYRTGTTREFTFTVRKGETDQSPGNVYVPGIMQESVEDIGTDIRDIIRTPAPFRPLAGTLLGKSWFRLLYPLALLIFVLAIIFIRILARRNADLKLVRNRQANRSARIRLKMADRFRKAGNRDGFYDEVGKAIWGYLGDKLNIETSALSRDMILEELGRREVEEEIRKEFLRILDESEFSRFAPSSEKSDVNQLYRDAVSLIRNLENSL